MNIIRIANATRELGRSQGFIPLHLRDDYISHDNGKQLHVMTAAFEVMPDELERIKNGAPVYVSIYGSMLELGSTLLDHIRAGSGWPPIHLTVGPLPVEENNDTPILPE